MQFLDSSGKRACRLQAAKKEYLRIENELAFLSLEGYSCAATRTVSPANRQLVLTNQKFAAGPVGMWSL
jgi:hypothetical protein